MGQMSTRELIIRTHLLFVKVLLRLCIQGKKFMDECTADCPTERVLARRNLTAERWRDSKIEAIKVQWVVETQRQGHAAVLPACLPACLRRWLLQDGGVILGCLIRHRHTPAPAGHPIRVDHQCITISRVRAVCSGGLV